MIQKNSNSKTNLRTWLFKSPVRFALWMLITGAILVGITYIPTIMNLAHLDTITMIATMVIFWFAVMDLIKHLPNHKMYHDDFVAVINGYKITSLILFAAWLTITKHTDMGVITSPVMTNVPQSTVSPWFTYSMKILWYMTGVYLLGLWISNIYVKFKRAVAMGFSKWKIVLTMPFCFMLTWMPGYITADTKQQTYLNIKSKWYARFNKWVLANQNNTLFTFLVLFVFAQMLFSKHIESSVFTLFLFAIYMFWKSIVQKNFSKQMNNWYIWTGIIMNIVMSVMFIRLLLVFMKMVIR